MEEDEAMDDVQDEVASAVVEDEVPKRRRRLRLPRPRLSALGSRAIWDDRFVLAMAAIAIACLAFAAGRFSVDPGPESVQEAMQLAQAGELPFSADGASAPGAPGGMGGGGGGARTPE